MSRAAQASTPYEAVIGQIVIDGFMVERKGVRMISPMRLLP
jgi:hypothetical protein